MIQVVIADMENYNSLKTGKRFSRRYAVKSHMTGGFIIVETEKKRDACNTGRPKKGGCHGGYL